MYPTPVWGTADVPGYGAGLFVPSGYKWTARTTELHPDGECKHRPPQGETPGGGTRASVKDPPHSREEAPGEHRPKRRVKDKGGGGHAKGATRGHSTTNRPQPGEAGNHTRTPQPGQERGHDTQHPYPHRAANPSQKGKDRHPKAPPPHHTHAHACTQHTPPKLSPTGAPQTHTTHQSASTARITNTHNTQKTQRTRTQQPPARGAAGPPETLLGHEGRPTMPKPRTSNCDIHTSTATNTQTERHNTLSSGNTRNLQRHRQQHQQPQHPPQHLRHPRQHQTNTRSHPTLTNDRRSATDRPAPRTIGNTNHQQSSQHNTLTITIDGGTAVLTNANDTYAHQHRIQHLQNPSQRHQ